MCNCERNSRKTVRDSRWRPPSARLLPKQTSLLVHKTLLFLSIFLHLTFPLLAPKPDYTTKPPEPPGTLYRRVCLQSLYHEHGGYSRCENGSSQLHFKQQNTATEFILQLRYAHHHPHLLQPPCCTEGSDTCCLQMFGLSVTHS